jgi:tRNA(Ser,Leu) C12 N-acetylase TAN1
MKDWNVLITIQGRNFPDAMEMLEEYGPAAATEYFNVAVMRVDDPRGLLEDLQARVDSVPVLQDILARVVPAAATFNFQDREDFEEKAKEAVARMVPRLLGGKFHVRMHRRGFKKQLSSMEEEKILSEFLLSQLHEAENPGSIEFEDPEAVIALETVGQRAGISLWTSAELKKYSLLGVD